MTVIGVMPAGFDFPGGVEAWRQDDSIVRSRRPQRLFRYLRVCGAAARREIARPMRAPSSPAIAAGNSRPSSQIECRLRRPHRRPGRGDGRARQARAVDAPRRRRLRAADRLCERRRICMLARAIRRDGMKRRCASRSGLERGTTAAPTLRRDRGARGRRRRGGIALGYWGTAAARGAGAAATSHASRRSRSAVRSVLFTMAVSLLAAFGTSLLPVWHGQEARCQRRAEELHAKYVFDLSVEELAHCGAGRADAGAARRLDTSASKLHSASSRRSGIRRRAGADGRPASRRRPIPGPSSSLVRLGQHYDTSCQNLPPARDRVGRRDHRHAADR